MRTSQTTENRIFVSFYFNLCYLMLADSPGSSSVVYGDIGDIRSPSDLIDDFHT